MDKINSFRNCITTILKNYSQSGPKNKDYKFQTIFDMEEDRYLVQSIGWKNGLRVYKNLIQMEIISGQIWIQCNSTEEQFAEEFENFGITKKDIVLGFFPDEERNFSEFATGYC